MGYKLLGFVVWNGAKWYLRARSKSLPKPVAIGAAALTVGGALAAAVAAAVARRGEE